MRAVLVPLNTASTIRKRLVLARFQITIEKKNRGRTRWCFTADLRPSQFMVCGGPASRLSIWRSRAHAISKDLTPKWCFCSGSLDGKIQADELVVNRELTLGSLRRPEQKNSSNAAPVLEFSY